MHEENEKIKDQLKNSTKDRIESIKDVFSMQDRDTLWITLDYILSESFIEIKSSSDVTELESIDNLARHILDLISKGGYVISEDEIMKTHYDSLIRLSCESANAQMHGTKKRYFASCLLFTLSKRFTSDIDSGLFFQQVKNLMSRKLPIAEENGSNFEDLALVNLIQSSPTNVVQQLIHAIVDFLPPLQLVRVLSQCTCWLSRDAVTIQLILENRVFEDKVLECANSSDSSSRKIALFLLNFIVSNLSTSSHIVHSLTECLLILETLESTQGHIIRPVLSNLATLYDDALKGSISAKWIAILFNRIMEQESKRISRWGMQLLLELGPDLFRTKENISLLENILFKHLKKTYFYYRPSFVDQGKYPPVLHQLQDFMNLMFEREDEENISYTFLLHFIRLFTDGKIGSTPFTMCFTVLANLKLVSPMKREVIDLFTAVNLSALPTQPKIVKGAVQCHMLKFICNNADLSDPGFIYSLEEFLDTLYFKLVLNGGHEIWNRVSTCCETYFTQSDSSDTVQLKQFVVETFNSLMVETGKFRSLDGFSCIIAMADAQKMLSHDLVELLLKPLLCCGSSLYCSTSLVFGSAAVFNQTFDYMSRGNIHKINSSLVDYCKKHSQDLFENAMLFMVRLSAKSSCSLKELYCISKCISNISKCIPDSTPALLNSLDSLLHSHHNAFTDTPVILRLSSLISAECFNTLGDLVLNYETGWLKQYLVSTDVSYLEASWICFSFLHRGSQLEEPVALLDLATESVMKMKSFDVIMRVMNYIKYLAPFAIAVDPKSFCKSVADLRCILSDFERSAQYWDLLDIYCSIMFDPYAMDKQQCIETILKAVNYFIEQTATKEAVIGHVVRYLRQYPDSDLQFVEDYVDTFLELTLLGTLVQREKQNSEDIIAFIRDFADSLTVNCLYKTSSDRIPIARIMVIDTLDKILQKRPELTLKFFDFYLREFKELDRPALLNTTSNRKKVRILQALLCLLPRILEQHPASFVLSKLLPCLSNDAQPAVRCYIVISICFVLSAQPQAIDEVFKFLISAKKLSNPNSVMTAGFSILTHHMESLEKAGALDDIVLLETLKHIGPWTCANNHSIRSFALACLIKLQSTFRSVDVQMPEFYVDQIEFIKISPDYRKLFDTLFNKNVFFSNFNIHDDLSLLNIFSSLPRQLNVAENECVDMNDLKKYVLNLALPVVSGEFHLIPTTPNLNEQQDYLISFADLCSSESIQKKITPWQEMASNLGIDFERGATSKGDLIVFASLIGKANNLGGLSRSGEIFGIDTLVIGNSEFLNNKEFKSLSMTSEKWLNVLEVRPPRSLEYFKLKKKEGYTIIGIEQSSKSVSLEKFSFPKKSVLVLGREREGVPVDLLNELDVCIEIPQLGLIRSLNVHVSASIVIWEYSKQHLFNGNNAEGS